MKNELDYLMNDKIEYVEKVIGMYEVNIDGQEIKITTTLDSNGYYQAEGKGPYLTSAANFQSEKEALLYAKRQITGTYDGTGVWIESK